MGLDAHRRNKVLKATAASSQARVVPSSSPNHIYRGKSTTWFSSLPSPPCWRPQGTFLPCTPDS